MTCPTCDSQQSSVIDSRPSPEGDEIRRRRVCPACGYRWTTYERVWTGTNVEEVRRLLTAALGMIVDKPVRRRPAAKPTVAA
jgi:hypothetical protein